MIRNQRGVTLLELLVAITLLAIVLIPVGNLFLLSFQTTGATKVQMSDRAVAVDILENFKETIRTHQENDGFSYGDDNLYHFSLHCFPNCVDKTIPIKVDSKDYEVEYTIKQFPFSLKHENSELYSIEVIVIPTYTPQANDNIEYSVIVMREKVNE